MRYTTTLISKLIAKNKHDDLDGIAADLHTRDPRTREAVGLSPELPTIEADAEALLNGYLEEN